jgi:hypothetical protein
MTETRHKLDEAKRFLKRMENVQSGSNSTTQEGIDEFSDFLSAFLSAARSVTLFMQVEFTDVPKFQEWYNAEQGKMKSDPIMRFLLEQRNITIHYDGHKTIQLHGLVRGDIGILFKLAASPDEIPETQPSPPNPAIASDAHSWIFGEIPGSDLTKKKVVPVCEEHIAKLERLLDECESRF